MNLVELLCLFGAIFLVAAVASPALPWPEWVTVLIAGALCAAIYGFLWRQGRNKR